MGSCLRISTTRELMLLDALFAAKRADLRSVFLFDLRRGDGGQLLYLVDLSFMRTSAKTLFFCPPLPRNLRRDAPES